MFPHLISPSWPHFHPFSTFHFLSLFTGILLLHIRVSNTCPYHIILNMTNTSSWVPTFTLSRSGLKVRCDAEVSSIRYEKKPFHFPFPPRLSAGDWQVDSWQEGEGYDPGYLQRSVATLRDSDFGFRVGRFSWVRFGQLVRKDAAWDSWRVGRRPEVCAD